ncbi:DJ-1 family glyoxalase III [Carboxylicivirga marina]|uniref:DJ-1 family glyoxalase III n=1 Tax=Carboxylicivirga marina TaxID=2800988 RepID=UPI002593C7D0|nr:DJ-1 family glyoxalase III [uncultured Carboxylicivirga sp.]
MKRVIIFLADGFEEVEALTPVDVLRRANVEVTTVSITENKQVCGSHNISVLADQTFNSTDFSNIDALILPGGMPGTHNLNAHAELKKVILDFANKGKLIGAICAAPLILGELDLLKNKNAVCYPGFEAHLKGANISSAKTIQDGNVITANAIGASMQFSINLVNELCGSKVANELAKKMLVSH